MTLSANAAGVQPAEQRNTLTSDVQAKSLVVTNIESHASAMELLCRPLAIHLHPVWKLDRKTITLWLPRAPVQ